MQMLWSFFKAVCVLCIVEVFTSAKLHAQQNNSQEKVFLTELERTPASCRRPLQRLFNSMRSSIDAKAVSRDGQTVQKAEFELKSEIRQVIASIGSIRNEIAILKRNNESRSNRATAAIALDNTGNIVTNNTASSDDLERAERQLQSSNNRLVQLERELRASRPGGPPEGPRSNISPLFYSSQQITIFFEPGSVAVRERHMRELVRFTADASTSVQVLAVIQSFTDRVGSTQSNFKMAEQRANLVAQIVGRLGVDQNRICTVVFGEDWDNDGFSSDAARKVEVKLHAFR